VFYGEFEREANSQRGVKKSEESRREVEEEEKFTGGIRRSVSSEGKLDESIQSSGKGKKKASNKKGRVGGVSNVSMQGLNHERVPENFNRGSWENKVAEGGK